MALSQEELDKFEVDFRYLAERYIYFFDVYTRLITKEDRTPEEESEFQTVHQMLVSIGDVLTKAMQAMGDEMFGKALDLYYRYKELAKEGNPSAQHLTEELKPLFEASLNSRINKN